MTTTLYCVSSVVVATRPPVSSALPTCRFATDVPADSPPPRSVTSVTVEPNGRGVGPKSRRRRPADARTVLRHARSTGPAKPRRAGLGPAAAGRRSALETLDRPAEPVGRPLGPDPNQLGNGRGAPQRVEGVGGGRQGGVLVVGELEVGGGGVRLGLGHRGGTRDH